MSFSFNVDIPEGVDMDRALATATRKAQENGVVFNGDTAAGTVKGKGVAGSYAISGRTMTITIDKKPFFISENMIIDGVTGAMENIEQHLDSE